MPAAPSAHPRVSLARFHSDIDEFLELAKTQPVVLTKHGRERHVIADIDYFRHLERMACGRMADDLHIEAIASCEMTSEDKQAFANARPAADALANDRWED